MGQRDIDFPTGGWYNIDVMPTLGQVEYGPKIGFRRHGKFIWVACPSCSKERWVSLEWAQQKDYRCFCRECSFKEYVGEKARHWKGGRREDRDYIRVYISRDSPFYPMSDHRKRYGASVAEHRLVMAQALGRCLEPWEVVHHLNGNKSDNRLENLQLMPTATEHHATESIVRQVKKLKNRVGNLERENRLLRGQVTDLIRRVNSHDATNKEYGVW